MHACLRRQEEDEEKGGKGRGGVNAKGVCARVEGWPTGGDGGDGGGGGSGGSGVLVKKPVITRLDSGLADRKIRSSPFGEDNIEEDGR